MPFLSATLDRVKPSPTIAVTGLVAELRAAGRDIISLGAGEPDFPTPENIREAGKRAIDEGKTTYTIVDGIGELKEAIAAKFARENELEYSTAEITVGTGGKQVLYNALTATLNPGDEVIIPAPYWLSYPDITLLAEGTPVVVQCPPETGFRRGPEELERAITPRTRWLVLNSPSNPTGAAYDKEQLKALGEVLKRHPHVWVLCDDIYEHLVYDGFIFHTFAAAVPEMYERTLTMNGVSKAYAMTGWRIGYAGGPKEVIGAMKTIQSQITSNPSSISQVAVAAALDGDQTCITEMVAAYKERSDYIVKALNEIPGFECRNGEGAFYAFPQVTGAMQEKGLAEDNDLVKLLLNEADVVMVPGAPFGAPGYVRISFACSIDELEKAVARIRATLV